MQIAGVPAPDFRVIRNSAELRNLRLPKTKYGWTVRTCRSDGFNEMDLFYKNCASGSTIKRMLKERFRSELARGEFYVVYPSWSFVFSMHVIHDELETVLEGVMGSQKGLARGTENAAFLLRIPFRMRSRMTSTGASVIPEELRSRLGKLMKYLSRIPIPRFYAEVAFIHTGEYIFYELRGLESIEK